MVNKSGQNKMISIVLILIICFTSFNTLKPSQASAATTYIKLNDYIKAIITELKIPVDTGIKDPYIDAALKGGLLKEGEFSIYTGYLTRADAAVLLNRADEIIYGNTSTPDQVYYVMEKKRISDIGKINKGKQLDVAKAFLKGYIKGFSNGTYSQSRSFKGSNKFPKADALNCIKMIKNKSLRAKISPDGQLIRTTNLPKNAKDYDYILASFPNKFYERQFEFMINDKWKDPTYKPYFAFPVDMKYTMFKTWNDEWSFKIEMNKYLYDWQEKAETYLNYLFNVDYRTVDDKWVEGLASCYAKSNLDEAERIRNYYLIHMKENKVIVKSTIITVDPSTLYYDNGYCMRAYVKYRITANDINVKQNRLLRSSYPLLEFLKSGVWREGIFDIRFGTNNGFNGDGAYWAIDPLTNFVDEFNVPIK